MSTIRNQALASCATLEAAKAMRTRLLTYQKEYYERTASEAQKEAVQGYVFDTRVPARGITQMSARGTLLI